MSRIEKTFERLKAEGHKALIPFITAGDPAPDQTVLLMHTLVAGGADIIELGVPFSDPMADGPTIQRASERALVKGMTLSKVLELTREFRISNQFTPIVLMGYANPIEAYGPERFARAAQEAGVDGVLVVDYPPEEGAVFSAQLREVGLDPIFLLAPTSSESRFAQVARYGRGYAYYVSLRGVTGASHMDLSEVATRLPVIREKVGMPVGVGFGIRDTETAAGVAKIADAVVIGSRLVEEIEQSSAEDLLTRVERFIHDLRIAMDKAVKKESMQ